MNTVARQPAPGQPKPVVHRRPWSAWLFGIAAFLEAAWLLFLFWMTLT